MGGQRSFRDGGGRPCRVFNSPRPQRSPKVGRTSDTAVQIDTACAANYPRTLSRAGNHRSVQDGHAPFQRRRSRPPGAGLSAPLPGVRTRPSRTRPVRGRCRGHRRRRRLARRVRRDHRRPRRRRPARRARAPGPRRRHGEGQGRGRRPRHRRLPALPRRRRPHGTGHPRGPRRQARPYRRPRRAALRPRALHRVGERPGKRRRRLPGRRGNPRLHRRRPARLPGLLPGRLEPGGPQGPLDLPRLRLRRRPLRRCRRRHPAAHRRRPHRLPRPGVRALAQTPLRQPHHHPRRPPPGRTRPLRGAVRRPGPAGGGRAGRAVRADGRAADGRRRGPAHPRRGTRLRPQGRPAAHRPPPRRLDRTGTQGGPLGQGRRHRLLRPLPRGPGRTGAGHAGRQEGQGTQERPGPLPLPALLPAPAAPPRRPQPGALRGLLEPRGLLQPGRDLPQGRRDRTAPARRVGRQQARPGRAAARHRPRRRQLPALLGRPGQGRLPRQQRELHRERHQAPRADVCADPPRHTAQAHGHGPAGQARRRQGHELRAAPGPRRPVGLLARPQPALSRGLRPGLPQRLPHPAQRLPAQRRLLHLGPGRRPPRPPGPRARPRHHGDPLRPHPPRLPARFRPPAGPGAARPRTRTRVHAARAGALLLRAEPAARRAASGRHDRGRVRPPLRGGPVPRLRRAGHRLLVADVRLRQPRPADRRPRRRLGGLPGGPGRLLRPALRPARRDARGCRRRRDVPGRGLPRRRVELTGRRRVAGRLPYAVLFLRRRARGGTGGPSRLPGGGGPPPLPPPPRPPSGAVPGHPHHPRPDPGGPGTLR
ncbi:hypothetical protein SBRY_150031 [Actinacidiphila bryophytorum]|uniref:Uncharacterized protein n=1 Tax=Actinacidiphila bryophytorum TaxID=1436133 RepID=A0A9W4GYN0_9ACTN|nr:hypothetical protein SBRY_150031 [Actinacidiphila bryophytorum]